MKTVKALEKKHRGDLWSDCDGYVWFWEPRKESWMCLFPTGGGWKVPESVPCDWERVDYSPFTRIQKGWR